MSEQTTALTFNITASMERFRAGVEAALRKDSPTVSLSSQTGLVVDNQCEPSQLRAVALKLRYMGVVNVEQRKLLDRYIGQAICSYAALTNSDWAQAISDMGLVEHTGKTYKTLIKLSRTVASLPDEAYTLPGLASYHLETATAFAGPEDPEKRKAFNEKRMEILRLVSQNPAERTRSWIMDEMRRLQREFNVTANNTRSSITELRKAFELCSQALLEWNEDDYITFGVTRGVLRDRWEGYRAEMIERGLLPDDSTDPLNFTLPWREQPAQDNEQPHDQSASDSVVRDESPPPSPETTIVA